MPFRPEANAAIQAESARPFDTIGWTCVIDKVGASPHKQATVTNDSGFRFVFTILNSEGLTTREIFQVCLHDTIAEVRKRRQGP